MDIRTALPVTARHEGEWKGEYVYVDPDGNVTDRHASHLSCTFPDDGPYPYYQINRYQWADGRSEELHFPATLSPEGDRMLFDTDRIFGWAADVKLDGYHRTTMLNWIRKDIPNAYLYEIINIDETNSRRARTWQWFKDGELYQRTIIKEFRVG